MYKHCTEQLKNGNHKLFYSTVASSTTDTRPPRKLSTDPNDWTIDDVVQYISEVDSTLGTHADAFRKHVNTVISFNICKYLNRHKHVSQYLFCFCFVHENILLIGVFINLNDVRNCFLLM